MEKPCTLRNLALFTPVLSPLQTSGGLPHLLSLPSPLLAQSGLSLSLSLNSDSYQPYTPSGN